jgi:hypothetical protein
MTDAYRNQTLLQSTADASALAGVMSLPDKDDAVVRALAYAAANMDTSLNGEVLKAADVFTGNWNDATKTFTPDGTPLDAVWVTTRRATANSNPLATNFLRIIGLQEWNISVEAIAIGFVSGCRRGGFVAANKVDVTSGNFFFNNICVHGQNMTTDPGHDYAIDLNNHNEYELGVQVSTPYLEDINNKHSGDSLEIAMKEGDIVPVDALGGAVQNLINGMTNTLSGNVPDYIETGVVIDAAAGTLPTIPITGDFIGPYVAGTIYVANCSKGKPLTLPTDTTISEVIIIANCPISASSGLILENVVIASTYVGPNRNDPLSQIGINLASAARLGAIDFCETSDGGVEVYALASARIAAKLGVNGLRAVVGGDFDAAAGGDVLGVSVQAGNDITFPANGNFGLCPQGTLPGTYALQYRLVW